MKIIEVELLVKDAEEEVGPRVQARACARTDALGVGDSSSTMIWSMSTSSIGSPRHVIRSRRSAWRRRGLEGHTDVGQQVHRQLVGEGCSSPHVRDPGISFHQISRPGFIWVIFVEQLLFFRITPEHLKNHEQSVKCLNSGNAPPTQHAPVAWTVSRIETLIFL